MIAAQPFAHASLMSPNDGVDGGKGEAVGDKGDDTLAVLSGRRLEASISLSLSGTLTRASNHS